MTLQAGQFVAGQLAPTVLADSDTGKGSPIGLFVVLLLVVAVYFLYRSMSRHVRRLPEKFPSADNSTEDDTDDTAGSDGAEQPGSPPSSPQRPT
jgi:hypothetical protein